jgi:hypothetical protein
MPLTRDDALNAISNGDFRALARYLKYSGGVHRDVRLALAEMINPDIPPDKRVEEWRLSGARVDRGAPKGRADPALLYGVPAELLYQERVAENPRAKRMAVEKEIADASGVSVRTVHSAWKKVRDKKHKPRNQKFWHEIAAIRKNRTKTESNSAI